MYTIKPSYRHFILEKLIGSFTFIIIFPLVMSLFNDYKFIRLLPIPLAICYFFVVFIYYPLKFKNTFYHIRRMSIVISRGVVFKYKIYIPCGAVSYIEKRQNILQKLSGSQTVVLYATGNKNYIRNLSYYAVRMIEIRLNEAKYYET